MSSSNIKLLENVLDYSSLKNKVISKNIANIGTEGYRKEDVNFNDFLSQSINNLTTTNSKHLEGIKVSSDLNFQISNSNDSEMSSGINNVDIDTEMANLAENTLLFKFASKKIGGHFRNLQNVIKGGGGN
jgi:flagellar basal-body rod protein FlgB